MKKEKNYWIEENNSWNCDYYTEDQAELNSKSLGDCRDCSDCRDFELNPQRIYSNLIGSRKSTTQVYWIEDNIQVVCGCFIGDLNDFENKVKQTHINSPKYLEDYLNFINKVRNYINN